MIESFARSKPDIRRWWICMVKCVLMCLSECPPPCLLPFSPKVLFIFFWSLWLFLEAQDPRQWDHFGAGVAILFFSRLDSYWHFQRSFTKCPTIVQSLWLSLFSGLTRLSPRKGGSGEKGGKDCEEPVPPHLGSHSLRTLGQARSSLITSLSSSWISRV